MRSSVEIMRASKLDRSHKYMHATRIYHESTVALIEVQPSLLFHARNRSAEDRRRPLTLGLEKLTYTFVVIEISSSLRGNI